MSNNLLERSRNLRQHRVVSILSLRCEVITWLRRPLGRLAIVALMLVLMLGGVPALEIHAHAAPTDEHAQIDVHADHAAVAHHATHFAGTGAGAGEHLETGTNTAGDSTLLHVHDACASASSLPETPRLPQALAIASSHEAAPIVLPAVDSRLKAPHRPPIA